MKGLLQGVDGGTTYNEYMALRHRNDALEEKIDRAKVQIQQLEQLVTIFTVSTSNPATTARLVQLQNFVRDRKKVVQDMVMTMQYTIVVQ